MSAAPRSERTGWSRLRREHPVAVTGSLVLVALLVVANGLLVQRWMRYRDETARLRSGMTEAEAQRTDMLIASGENRFAVMMELVRRQAAADRDLHLSVAVDSGVMLLERDRVVLRRMDVDVGPDHLFGSGRDTVRVVPPRGARSISRMLSRTDAWEVPEWVFTLRGLPIPAERVIPGVLGRDAVLLTGGTVIYALPDSGILADSAFILPGSFRLRRADLRAIAPNLEAGQSVYFYD